MAIHPTLRRSQATATAASQNTLSPQQALAISTWTEQATASVQDLNVSEPAPANTDAGAEDVFATGPNSAPAQQTFRGTSIPLAIPLDDDFVHNTEQRRPAHQQVRENNQKVSVSFRRREPVGRDHSLKRCERLLKGKDGSRRRQRWENDRLLNNPWAEPPSANDWLIQPTYPRHDHVPYYLAPLWDIHYAHVDRNSSKKATDGANEPEYRIPKELRIRLKHARAARGMLQDLEEDIRRFIQRWNEKQATLKREGLQDAPSSEEDSEDEVVFVGRNGQMHDTPERKQRLQQMRQVMDSQNERNGEKMVLESVVDDRTAGFGRWLVHSIASYYGLHTWSITTAGEPARRKAYVGFRSPNHGSSRAGEVISHAPVSATLSMIRRGEELPAPLWKQL